MNFSTAESERKIKRLLEGCHLRFGSSIGALVGGGVYFGFGAQSMFYGAGIDVLNATLWFIMSGRKHFTISSTLSGG